MLYHHPESPACGDQGEFLLSALRLAALLANALHTRPVPLELLVALLPERQLLALLPRLTISLVTL